MTPDKQRELLTDFMNSVRDTLLENSDKWPEDWNGVELRTLVKQAIDHEFSGFVSGEMSKRRRRGKDFFTTYINENLY